VDQEQPSLGPPHGDSRTQHPDSLDNEVSSLLRRSALLCAELSPENTESEGRWPWLLGGEEGRPHQVRVCFSTALGPPRLGMCRPQFFFGGEWQVELGLELRTLHLQSRRSTT
jgi:hypothetical protein